MRLTHRLAVSACSFSIACGLLLFDPAQGQDTPLALSCIGVEEIADSGLTNLDDLNALAGVVRIDCMGGGVPNGQEIPLVDLRTFSNVPIVGVSEAEVVIGDPAERILCDSSHPTWDPGVRTCRVVAGQSDAPNVYRVGAYGTFGAGARLPIQGGSRLNLRGIRAAPWFLRREGRTVSLDTSILAADLRRIPVAKAKARSKKVVRRRRPSPKSKRAKHCESLNIGSSFFTGVPFILVDNPGGSAPPLSGIGSRQCLDFSRVPLRSGLFVRNRVVGSGGAQLQRTTSATGPFEAVPSAMTVMSNGESVEISPVELTDGAGQACWEQTADGAAAANDFNFEIFPSWTSDGTRPGSPLEGTAFARHTFRPVIRNGVVTYQRDAPQGPAYGSLPMQPAGDPYTFPIFTAESCSGAPAALEFGEPFDANRTLLYNIEQQGNQAPVVNVPILSPNAPADLSVSVDVDPPQPLPGASQTAQWLTAELNGNEAPTALRIELATDGLPIGEHRGTIVINSPQAAPIELTVVVRMRAPRPYFEDAALLNAAGQQPGAVAPGMAFVLFGAHFGPAALQTLLLGDDGRVVADLGGVRVLFDGDPAPMIYSFNGQISGFTPYSVAGKESVDVEVEWQGELSRAMTLPVLETAPGFFTLDQTGGGQAAALNSDFSVNTPDNRAPVGGIVQLFGTGPGQTDPPGVDGQIVAPPLPRLLAQTMVWIDEQPAEVVYSGPAPGLADGVWQVNARIGPDVQPGDRVPVRAKVGENWTQPGTVIAVKPRDD